MNKKQFIVLASLYWILATPLTMFLIYVDCGYRPNDLFWSSQIAVLAAGCLMLVVWGLTSLVMKYEYLFDRLG